MGHGGADPLLRDLQFSRDEHSRHPACPHFQGIWLVHRRTVGAARAAHGLFGVIAPFAGALMLRYGPRKVVSASAALLIIGIVLAMTTQTRWQL